ncbi:MAG TPA: hypothetical protein VGE74_31775 [Gemmata sp.]
MSAPHKLQITLDEATGDLRVRHYATTELGGARVVAHEEVSLTPDLEAEVRAHLAAILDANRAAMDAHVRAEAARHAAAVHHTEKRKPVALTAGAGAKGHT